MKQLIGMILLYTLLTACFSTHYSHKTEKPMFTLQQIKDAHSKVKSGADFPAYINVLVQLGVARYTTHVADSHTDYIDQQGRAVSSDPKYIPLKIADKSNKEQFQKDLKAHQQGKTDYLTFCEDCAQSGIEKWIVDMEKMTCTYYDKSGIEILVEVIPAS